MATPEQIDQVRLNIDDLEPTIDNWIDRGNCESPISPAMRNETTVTKINVSWERSSEKQYLGAYSYKLIKTITDGLDARVALTDNIGASDLHGFTPGEKYTFSCRLYLPDGIGLDYSKVNIKLNYFDGSWIENTQVAQQIYNEWQYVYITMTIPITATGATVQIHFEQEVIENQYIYADDIKSYIGEHVEERQDNVDFSDEIIENYIELRDSVVFASYKLIDILIMRLNRDIIKIDDTGSESNEFQSLKDRLAILENQRDKYKYEYDSGQGNTTGKFVDTVKPAGGMI
jgi:hypothetical protein